jgi:hypothetical protein
MIGGLLVLWAVGMYFSLSVHKDVKGSYFEGDWRRDLLMVAVLWPALLPIQLLNHPRWCNE